MSIIPKSIKFNNGCQMPLVGLGTWQSTKEEGQKAVRNALECGYRAIDTAYMYLNENDIGDVLDEYITGGKIERNELFITTKLCFIHNRPADVKEGLDRSLTKLKLDYVDLFLMHAPVAMKKTDDADNVLPVIDGKLAQEETDICAVWKEMEKLVDTGKTKSIGLSNFNSDQVKRILEIAKIKPVTNQVECHAYLAQTKMQDFLKKNDIVLTAFGPLGSPGRTDYFREDAKEPVLLEENTIKNMAAKYKKSPAQILLRNLIQRGIAIVPKSVNPVRMKENLEIFDFELTTEEMKSIASLDRGFRMFLFKGIFDGLKENPFSTEF